MHTIEFEGYERDHEKARSKLRKHGVDFADAVAVFEDEWALTMIDVLLAVNERRQLTLGCDGMGRVLLVAYTWRGTRIRIFSARRASPRERRQYREGRA